jgi:hypothetical protein
MGVDEATRSAVRSTREYRDADVGAVLEMADAPEESAWVEATGSNSFALEHTHDDTRYVVVTSDERKARDDRRREELLVRTEDKLVSLAERAEAKRLDHPARIGAAADGILPDSGVGRCFSTTIRAGYLGWDFDAKALDYEERLLDGRYVITTSLDQKVASTAAVVRQYKMPCNVERRFRVMKDLLGMRPFHHAPKRACAPTSHCASPPR